MNFGAGDPVQKVPDVGAALEEGRAEMEQPLLLSVIQASQICNLGRSLFYQKVMAGEIASVKINRRRLIPRAALEAYVSRLLAEAEAETGTAAA